MARLLSKRHTMLQALNGALVAKTSQAAPVVTLDVSKMPTGIYTVSVVTEDGVYSRKIMKVD